MARLGELGAVPVVPIVAAIATIAGGWLALRGAIEQRRAAEQQAKIEQARLIEAGLYQQERQAERQHQLLLMAGAVAAVTLLSRR